MPTKLMLGDEEVYALNKTEYEQVLVALEVLRTIPILGVERRTTNDLYSILCEAMTHPPLTDINYAAECDELNTESQELRMWALAQVVELYCGEAGNPPAGELFTLADKFVAYAEGKYESHRDF